MADRAVGRVARVEIVANLEESISHIGNMKVLFTYEIPDFKTDL